MHTQSLTDAVLLTLRRRHDLAVSPSGARARRQGLLRVSRGHRNPGTMTPRLTSRGAHAYGGCGSGRVRPDDSSWIATARHEARSHLDDAGRAALSGGFSVARRSIRWSRAARHQAVVHARAGRSPVRGARSARLARKGRLYLDRGVDRLGLPGCVRPALRAPAAPRLRGRTAVLPAADRRRRNGRLREHLHRVAGRDLRRRPVVLGESGGCFHAVEEWTDPGDAVCGGQWCDSMALGASPTATHRSNRF